MSISNFPGGASSFGGVLTGSGLPIIPASYPNFVSPGGAADPSVPAAFFLSGDGNDSNDGLTPGTAFATLLAAYNACTSNCNQIIYFIGTQTSSKILTAITWAKNRTHLVGMCAPVGTSNRARFSVTGLISPVVTVTGQGCIFANFDIFNGPAATSTSNSICWQEGGGRNYYQGVSFDGGGNATQATDASCRSLVIAGNTGENLFVGCSIGLDTVPQSAASASMEILAGAASPRNRFQNCIFIMYATATTPVFVKIGAGSLDRYLSFEYCRFRNSGTSTLAQAFSINGAPGGNMDICDSTVSPPQTALVTGNSAFLFGNNASAAATGNRSVALTG